MISTEMPTFSKLTDGLIGGKIEVIVPDASHASAKPVWLQTDDGEKKVHTVSAADGTLEELLATGGKVRGHCDPHPMRPPSHPRSSPPNQFYQHSDSVNLRDGQLVYVDREDDADAPLELYVQGPSINNPVDSTRLPWFAAIDRYNTAVNVTLQGASSGKGQGQ